MKEKKKKIDSKKDYTNNNTDYDLCRANNHHLTI